MSIGEESTLRPSFNGEPAVDKPAHKRIDAVLADVDRIDRVIRGDGERPGLAEQLRGVQASIEALRLECIEEMQEVRRALEASSTPSYVWGVLVLVCLAGTYAAIEIGRHFSRGGP